MKGDKNKLVSGNNYCQNSHIISEHLKSKSANSYIKVQKCLFFESICLENKNPFNYEKWILKE